MSDLNDANADAAIEPVIPIPYSTVCFTGLRIELRADLHSNLLDDNVIFADCITNGTVIQESAMIKEAESTCWELTQNIQISTEIPLFMLSILSRYPGHDDYILTQVEMQTASFISELVRPNPWGSQAFTRWYFCSSVLELGFRGVVVPSGPSSNHSSADGNSLFDLPTMNGQSGPDLPFNFRIGFPESLSDHGNQLLHRIMHFVSEDNLQNAIFVLERSLLYTPDSDPNRPSRLSDLCHAFTHRFEFLRNSRDLDQAIELGNHAVTLTDDQPGLFLCLSRSYFLRFDTLGNLDDLNSAVSAAKFGTTKKESCSKASLLYTLAGYIRRQFGLLGDLDDIESAIEMERLAFSLVPEGDESRLWALYNTALSFSERFDHLGKSDDFEESISEGRKALDFMPEDFPQRCWMLSNLSSGLRNHFVLFDDPADLEEAIVKGMDAVNAVPSRSPDRPGILNNLSICFSTRFDQNGDVNDLTEFISLLQSTLSDTPDCCRIWL
ncbi:hypothetical protein EDD18DRAFT_1355914 [Armillaria luteobubalina]|uniref:TPR-like protein n=1 Tax=Armillaria luteobubalina TaxID=153913 RepID=A0AA39Q0M7_9AGAR|nr:hypothetical protein EDD18DRAFT_1355914 [Armillaria luteobubalina]